VAPADETRTVTGVQYATRLGFRPLLLDVHLPPGDGPFPFIAIAIALPAASVAIVP